MYCSLTAYLLLFSASYYLHSPSTAAGTQYRRNAVRLLIRTSWGSQQRLVATWAELQHSVVYYQCRKRLEACIHAEGGHSEHLLWRCLPDIPVATHHNRFFSEQPMSSHNRLFKSHRRLKERNKPSFRWKSFTFHKLVWWHSRGGVGKWITVFFLER